MSDNRFPRSARLLQASEFKRVFNHPQRSSDAYFTVLAVAGGPQSGRLGLAVSKKQARRAVDRNRLKRLIRESFRKRGATLVGIDLVVMIRTAALEADNKRLSGSLARHMERLASKFNRPEQSRAHDQ